MQGSVRPRRDRPRPEYQKAWRNAHPEQRRAYARQWNPKGSNVRGLPALSIVDVRAIRQQLALGVARKALAVAHRVSYNTIRRIDEDVTYNTPAYYELQKEHSNGNS